MSSLHPHKRYLWGRRQSRPLKPNQKDILNKVWPNVLLELPEGLITDPLKMFSLSYTELWLEIGFGGGEHLVAQAIAHADIGFIGCEPYINGVASLACQIHDQQLHNIRIVKDDARLLVAKLPSNSVGRLFVLFPDPWPKKRHHKRRIIQEASVAEFARILKPGGQFNIATDDQDYASWIQNIMEGNSKFELILGNRIRMTDRPTDWPVTRYEQKGIVQGRVPVYLTYTLKSL